MEHVVQCKQKELRSPVIVSCNVVVTFLYKLHVVYQWAARKLVVYRTETENVEISTFSIYSSNLC